MLVQSRAAGEHIDEAQEGFIRRPCSTCHDLVSHRLFKNQLALCKRPEQTPEDGSLDPLTLHACIILRASQSRRSRELQAHIYRQA